MKKIEGTNVVDVKVNWQAGTFQKVNEIPMHPEGLFPYTVTGTRETAPEAVAYMRKLLECAGVDLERLEGWEDKMTAVRYMVHDRKHEVPADTLFLGVYADTRKKLQWEAKMLPEEAAKYMLEDEETAELGKWLAGHKHYARVWLHVMDRRYRNKKMPKYVIPCMSALVAKAPFMAKLYPYYVQLTRMDLVY